MLVHLVTHLVVGYTTIRSQAAETTLQAGAPTSAPTAFGTMAHHVVPPNSNGLTAGETCEPVEITLNTQTWASEITWELSGPDGVVAVQSDPVGSYSNYQHYTKHACLPLGMVTLSMHDSFGDGWNGGTLDITAPSGASFIHGASIGSGSTAASHFDVALPVPLPPSPPPTPPSPPPSPFSPPSPPSPPPPPAPTLRNSMGDYLFTMSTDAPECCSQWGLAAYPDTGYTWPLVSSEGTCSGGMIKTTEEWIDAAPTFNVAGLCLADGYYTMSYDPEPLPPSPPTPPSPSPPAPCAGLETTITLYTESWASEITWEVECGNTSMATSLPLGSYTDHAAFTTHVCMTEEPPCQAHLYDSFGDGWHGGHLTITHPSGEIIMNAGQDFTSGAEKVYTYPSASTPTSAPTSFGTSAGGSGGGTGAGNGYPLCEGLPPANYCDGTGDCVNQPTWCSCSDAAALCAANGYPMVTKAAKQAKMAAAKKTGLVAKAAPTHLLSSPGKKMKPCATGAFMGAHSKCSPNEAKMLKVAMFKKKAKH